MKINVIKSILNDGSVSYNEKKKEFEIHSKTNKVALAALSNPPPLDAKQKNQFLAEIQSGYNSPESPLWLQESEKIIQYLNNKFGQEATDTTALICHYQKINKNPRHLLEIPDELKTLEMCKLAVKLDPSLLSAVPEQLQTQEMCKEAIKNEPFRLQYVSEKLITKQMCEKAIEQEPLALKYVPEKFKTKQMCEKAVQQEPICLQYVPDTFRTQKMFEQAVEKNPGVLILVPEEARNLKMCLGVMKVAPHLLHLFPLEDPDKKEQFLKAIINAYDSPESPLWVEKSKKIIQALNDKFPDNGNAQGIIKEIQYYTSINEDPLNFLKIPHYSITYQMCKLAVQKDPNLFAVIPEGAKTRELCKEALEKNPFNVKYMPDGAYPPRLLRNATSGHVGLFEHDRIIEEAIKQEPLCLYDSLVWTALGSQSLSTDKKKKYNLRLATIFATPDMRLIAVKKRPQMFFHLAYDQMNMEMWNSVMETAPYLLPFTEDSHQNNIKIFNAILKNDPGAISLIASKLTPSEGWQPDQLLTPDALWRKKALIEAWNSALCNIEDIELLENLFPLIPPEWVRPGFVSIPLNALERTPIETLNKHLNEWVEKWPENSLQSLLITLQEMLQRNTLAISEQFTKVWAPKCVKRFLNLFEYIPNEFKTQEMCLKVTEKDPELIRHVPDELKTAQMCMEVVHQKPQLIRHLPNELKTQEMCMEAVKKQPQLIEYVPDTLKTAEICMEAVKQKPHLIRHVPDKLQTEELCMEAVKQKPELIRYLPNELKSREFFLKLIQTRYECFRFLNQEYQADPKLQACHFLGIQKQCASIIDGKRLSLTPVPSQINKEIKTATSEPSAQGDYKTTLEDCSTFINSLKLNNLPLSLQACNTKGKLAEQKIALHAALKTLAKRIDTNEGYLGTPPVGTPALKSFYGQIKYYLSDIQKHLDPLKDAEEYLQLLLAADVCGGGLLAHLDQLHTRLCSADSSLSAEAICAKLIGGEIKLFIESKNQDRNVHTNNTYQRLLKDYIGGPDVFNDPFGPTINPMDLLEMLFREITVSRILEELARDLKNNEPLKERLIEYIEDRLFEGKELEQKDKDTFQEEFNGQLKALIESKERCGPNIPSFEVLQAVAQTDRITVLKKKCPNLDSEILNAILTNRDKIIPLVTEVIPQLKNLTGLSSQALLTMDEQNIQLAFEGNTPKRAEQFYAEQFRKKYRDGDGNFNQDGLAIVLEHMGLIRNLGPD